MNFQSKNFKNRAGYNFIKYSAFKIMVQVSDYIFIEAVADSGSRFLFIKRNILRQYYFGLWI